MTSQRGAGTRQREPRRRPGRRRHHERDPRRPDRRRRAAVERHRLRVRAADVAGESSQAWNNAGTGHSALCELNYTPAGPDGRVDPAKAVTINEQFQVSRQFWSYLVARRADRLAQGVHHPGPAHELRAPARTAAPTCGPATRRSPPSRCSQGLEYSEDPAELAEWMPLMMAGRDPQQIVAATRVGGRHGRQLRRPHPACCSTTPPTAGSPSHCNQRVQGLERRDRRPLAVDRRATPSTGERRTVRTRFVFVGAGGGALPLLQRSGIPEITRLRRLPGQRQVPAHPIPGAGRQPPGEGLRPGRGRRAADVGAAPGPPPDRRRPLADVRAVRRLLARSSSRPARCSTCRSASGRTTWARCSASRAPSWPSPAT